MLQKYDWSRLITAAPALLIIGYVVLALFAVALIILACWDWFWSPMFGLPVMNFQEALGATMSLAVVVGVIAGLKER